MISRATHRQIQEALRRHPWLRTCPRRNESAPDAAYNCLAWAFGESHRWWEPGLTVEEGAYWPDGVPQEFTLAPLLMILDRLGYKVCADGQLEAGKEKIALYLGCGIAAAIDVEHVARQLPDGWWTHKLGQQIGIETPDPRDVSREYGDRLLFAGR